MEKEIIEGNKLIAEFMGDFKLIKEFKPEPDVDITYMWKKISNKSFGYDTTDWRDYSTDTEYSDRVCYNSSWDWLMPVCTKIGEIYEYGEYIKKSSGFLIDAKDIKATWENVVEFIKWLKCQK